MSPVADLQTLGTPICSFSSCAVVEKGLWFSITARQIKTYPFSSYVHTCQTLPQDSGLSLACFKMKYDLLISINRPKKSLFFFCVVFKWRMWYLIIMKKLLRSRNTET